jgi:hypothetical protein
MFSARQNRFDHSMLFEPPPIVLEVDEFRRAIVGVGRLVLVKEVFLAGTEPLQMPKEPLGRHCLELGTRKGPNTAHELTLA